jgi:hypothetical protein
MWDKFHFKFTINQTIKLTVFLYFFIKCESDVNNDRHISPPEANQTNELCDNKFITFSVWIMQVFDLYSQLMTQISLVIFLQNIRPVV